MKKKLNFTNQNHTQFLKYLYQRISRDATNLSLVKRRGYDGYIVSMHQAGTHWLLHMLAIAITEKYGIEMPDGVHTNFLKGEHTQTVSQGLVQVPRITQSHQIPNPLLTNAFMQRILNMPNYLLLVRDPRVILVSHYKRYGHLYKISFSEYLHTRHDLMRRNGGARKFDKDIWWDIRFQNSWHSMCQSRPIGVCVVKYEDLKNDTLGNLRKIIDYFKMALQQNLWVNFGSGSFPSV